MQRPLHIPLPQQVGSFRHNLPIPLTSLIGREQDTASACALLKRQDVRLLTFTGAGGVGKTRLGLQIATALVADFSDGVFFVPLAPVRDPEFVVSTLAQTLQLRETRGLSFLDLLKTFLRDKHLLLLLDNFEQVLTAAPHLTDLLAFCPNLKFLVTSRAVLHVQGEHEFPVSPLALPDLTHLPDLLRLSQYEAVSLFIVRAQAVKSEFQMTNNNAPSVAEICVRLDGLPLAIELATARIKMLSPQALLARLEHRLQVLTNGTQDAPSRQQTLRNTIAWSYDLLDADEQRLFRRLSVFVGGSTLETIEALCTALGDEPGLILDGVASLLDKSLLRQRTSEREESRFWMLETLREFGLEALTANGELEITQQAHAQYYLSLADEAAPKLEGAEEQYWFNRLEREHDNLRAALNHFLEHGETERALQLGGALGWFWKIHCHFSEGLHFLEQALARSEGLVITARTRALDAAGLLAYFLGDLGRAELWKRKNLMLFRQLEDQAGIALTLAQLGFIVTARSNFAESRALYEESIGIYRKTNNKLRLVHPLYGLATLLAIQGEYAKSRVLLEENLAMSRELRSKWRMARSLFRLSWVIFLSEGVNPIVHPLIEECLMLFKEIEDGHGISCILSVSSQIALHQGDIARARSLAEESLAIGRGLGIVDAAGSLCDLARIIAFQGDLVTAFSYYEESLALARKGYDKVLLADCLEGMASIAVAQGKPIWAIHLWGVAEALRDSLAAPIPPVYRANYEHSVATARAQLGEPLFTAGWAEGRSMTLDQVLSARELETISEPDSTTHPSLPAPKKLAPAYPDGLTTREVEVLRLVAQGLSNAEIAEQLIISLLTVKAHIRSLYNKLDISSRSAATRYAIEHHLV